MDSRNGDGLGHAWGWRAPFGLVLTVAIAGAFAGLLIWERFHPIPCHERYPDARSQYLACEIERLKAQIRELEDELKELNPPDLERPRP